MAGCAKWGSSWGGKGGVEPSGVEGKTGFQGLKGNLVVGRVPRIAPLLLGGRAARCGGSGDKMASLSTAEM